jgi:hypothetical protein
MESIVVKEVPEDLWFIDADADAEFEANDEPTLGG